MSTRTLTTSMAAAVDAIAVRPILLYHGAFEGGDLRMWSGVGTLSLSGESWVGAGQLLGVSAIGETLDTRAEGIEVSLSGMPSSLISTVLANARYGKAGKLWLAALDDSENIIVDPYLSFSGKLDQPQIDDSGEVCTISIRYESNIVDLQRARTRRYTPEDQKLDHPGDLGFEFVASLIDKSITWGPWTAPTASDIAIANYKKHIAKLNE